MAVELSRVIGGAPQLITIGADKTLAIWDTISFKVFIIGIHVEGPCHAPFFLKFFLWNLVHSFVCAHTCSGVAAN